MSSVVNKDGDGYSRKWKDTKAVHGETAVQRLSRLALSERRKTANRFRIVENGRVVASFQTKEAVEAALKDPGAKTYNEELLRRFSSVHNLTTPRSTSPNSPNSSPATSSAKSPAASASAKDLSAKEASEPKLHKTQSTPPQARRVSFAVAASTSHGDADDDDSDELLASPRNAAFAKDSAATKVNLTDDERERRRAEMCKPEQPGQEPEGEFERAMSWHYDEATKAWTTKEMWVKIARTSFAEGAMRSAFKMLGRPTKAGQETNYVAKLFNEMAEKEMICPSDEQFGNMEPDKPLPKSRMMVLLERQASANFLIQLADKIWSDNKMLTARQLLAWITRVRLFQQDAEMQGFCRMWATRFNELDPPKPVVFCDAFLIVMTDRPDQTIYSCEPFIAGDYVKHNNNAGAVGERTKERNTPQAFSHFTYEESKGECIIVDIQGVNDTYTDPQVHSLNGGFGAGNLGKEGMDAFFKTHRCNNICIGLGLSKDKIDAKGTVCNR